MQVRSADAVEIDHLTRLWHDGWHQTHASLVPQELTRLRTSESFRERLQAALPNVLVTGPLGAPIGFYVLKGDEFFFFQAEDGIRDGNRSARAPARPSRS